MQQPIQSDAFRRATLRSEQYRILGLLGICGFFIVLNLVRVLLSQLRSDRNSLIRLGIFVTWWALFAAYEGMMLALATRARRKDRAVGQWVWVLNTIIECLLPTIALLGLTADKGYLGPYRALMAAPALVYCLFIILSTLRLSPVLCILSGLVSACGYLAVYLITLKYAPDNQYRKTLPAENFIIAPIVIFGCGVIAAVVARRIRQHVIDALAEAETRRRLDRVEHDLRTARTIQMGLLPKCPPTIPGYDIAGFSEPAEQTGGDYYDWIELPDGKIIFTIADATGHGIGPALLIAACRAYFRAIARRDDPLEQITAQVDALVAADAPDGRFITAAIALLDPKANQLSLYSAGQAPIYLYASAADRIERFDADQPPLGTRYNGDGEDGCRARLIQLAPGDSLVLVTDGFFECSSPTGEQLGTSRLGDAIRLHHSLPAEDLIRRLHQDVLAFSQTVSQGDDLTAVVIKRSGALGTAD